LPASAPRLEREGDAGKIDWHPSVVAETRKTGLSVDDDGNLLVDKRPAA
jgi:hypothetical protein